MRLDHLLSKEEITFSAWSNPTKTEEEVKSCCLLLGYQDNQSLLVAMRLGVTPVPIPNTMVKTQTADGTALETVWESRWPPNLKKKERRQIRCRSLKINTGKDEQQLINANPISRAVLLKAGFTSDQSSKEVLGSDD